MSKTILITGGTSGLGAATSLHFLQHSDYNIISIGRTEQSVKSLEQTCATATKLKVLQGDLTDKTFIDSLVLDLNNANQSVDYLVNCAGIIGHGGIEQESMEVWNRVMSINLDAVFTLIKSLLGNNLLNSGGSIVNVSSICAKKVCTSISYSVSKAALDALTRALAIELAPKKITVNSINPGLLKTNLHHSAKLFESDNEYDDWFEQSINKHPIKRAGTVEEVARLISYLISKDASWITGNCISIDGGRAVL